MTGSAALAVAFIVSLAACALIARYGARDTPDGGRKDHARPIATLGGLGIAAGHLAALLAMHLSGVLPASPLARSWLDGFDRAWPILVAFGLGFLATGLADDLRPMTARTKLFVLAILSAGVSLLGWQGLGGDGSSFGALSLAAGLIAGGALWVFVLTNATNFMDGSNGLAMGCCAIMLAALFGLGAPSLALVCAIAGFLVLNLTGRLFAGDTGSLHVGFWVSALALLGAAQELYSIWIPPLIALPFLTDVILTVIWRARRGGNVMQAHREHAYQLFRRAGWGHLQVALFWWAMTAACGALAVWAAGQGEMVQFAAFAGALAISITLWLIQRRAYWPRVSSPG